MKKAIITFDGILSKCFNNVRTNFYEKIDENVHAEVYVGDHHNAYAEPEFTGKYMDICAYYYESEKDKRAYDKGMKVALSVYKNQRPDGYFGGLSLGNELEAFSVWNQGFTLYGLTRMYEISGDERIKETIIKGADWLYNIFIDPKVNDIYDAPNNGSQHISCIYAMCKAYTATGDKKYLDFVTKMLLHGETTDMNLLSFNSIFDLRSKKGIEMLVIYIGVLHYGLLTGNTEAMDAARRYWQEIYATQIRNTGNGTVKEVWEENGNAAKILPTEINPNETCVAVGWCELSLKLFYLEQKKEYLDAVEKTLFNHLIGSLAPNGSDLAYYQGNCGKKVYRTNEGAYQCCRYRGFTLFSYLKEFLYYSDDKTIIPMVYCQSSYETEDLKISQTTNYPSNGYIVFDIENKKDSKQLKLRIPYWCNSFSVTKDGCKSDAEVVDGYVNITLPQGKTKITLELDIGLSVCYNEIDGIDYTWFTYGPLLLALDTCYGNSIEDKACSSQSYELLETNGQLLHIIYGNLHLVDYASAGSTNLEKDVYTVFIKSNT